jgi:hypothetical protein
MEQKKAVPQIQVRSYVRSGAGGWVNGVWYADMSGVCSGAIPPTPLPAPIPPTGGGWVNGVWYADRSGVCG